LYWRATKIRKIIIIHASDFSTSCDFDARMTFLHG
jgi:hypothetical protein